MANTQGQGWHGDSKGHAKAAKGENTTQQQSNESEQGWHGDSKGHAKAAKGESKDENASIVDKILP